MAFWNGTVQLMGTPESRVVLVEGVDELASLMCGLKCPNAAFQVTCLLFYGERLHKVVVAQL